MALQKTDKIWHNGKLIRWEDATIHVMSHVVHYGSSVFEGSVAMLRPAGPAIFRAQRTHAAPARFGQDLSHGRRVHRRRIGRGHAGIGEANGVWPCYIRPIVLRGYGDAGVTP